MPPLGYWIFYNKISTQGEIGSREACHFRGRIHWVQVTLNCAVDISVGILKSVQHRQLRNVIGLNLGTAFTIGLFSVAHSLLLPRLVARKASDFDMVDGLWFLV